MKKCRSLPGRRIKFVISWRPVSSPPSQRRILTDELSTVCQGKFTRSIDQVTNKIPNSPAQKPARRQVSPPYSGIALPSPSFPTHPRSPIDSCLEGSLTAESHARHRTGKKLSNRRRRMCDSFAQYPPMTADSMRCRPAIINRHAP
jgi:hypothetical protein